MATLWQEIKTKGQFFISFWHAPLKAYATPGRASPPLLLRLFPTHSACTTPTFDFSCTSALPSLQRPYPRWMRTTPPSRMHTASPFSNQCNHHNCPYPQVTLFPSHNAGTTPTSHFSALQTLERIANTSAHCKHFSADAGSMQICSVLTLQLILLCAVYAPPNLQETLTVPTTALHCSLHGKERSLRVPCRAWLPALQHALSFFLSFTSMTVFFRL